MQVNDQEMKTMREQSERRRTEAIASGSSSATCYAALVEKLEGIRDQLANLRDEIPTDYKGRRVDGEIWDMLGHINNAQAIAKDA